MPDESKCTDKIKKGKKEDLGTYRAVSLTSVTAKVMKQLTGNHLKHEGQENHQEESECIQGINNLIHIHNERPA